MRPRLPWIMVLVTLTGLALVYLLTGDPVTIDTDAATTRTGTAPPSTNDAADRDRRRPLAVPPGPGSKAPGVDAPPGAEPRRDRGALPVRIRVVDAAGDPVPAAEVAAMPQMFTWSAMSDADRYRVRQYGFDLVGLYGWQGQRHRCDGQGRLQLSIDKHLYLACRHQDAFGQLTLDARNLGTADEHLLRLTPTHDLRVRVVDPAGKPVAGIPLQLRLHWQDPELARRLAPRAALGVSGATGADGTLLLPNLPLWGRYFDAASKPTHGEVAPLVLGLPPEWHRIDLRAPPADPVELRIPATGAVIVRLRDDRGNPVGSYEDCQLGLESDPDRPRYGHSQPAGPGAARFPFVVLGAMLRAFASHAIKFEPKVVPGPRRPGEVLTIDLVTDPNASFLAGRVLDAEGRPLGRRPLGLRFEATDYTDPFFRITTEPDGHFRFPLSDGLLGAELRQLSFQLLEGIEYGLPWIATIDGPVRLSKGRNDLGTVQLRALPLLVAGRVTVDDAPPTRQPALTVEARRGDDWRIAPTAVVRWLPAGRFEVRGLPGPAAHRLQVADPQCLPVPATAFEAGRRDLHIALVRGGSLRATVLLDDPGNASKLAPELVRDTAGRPDAPGRGAPTAGISDRLPVHVETEANGARFAWTGLVAGDYRLRLELAGAATPVIDLDHLAVPPGGACADPRLTVDLRGKLRQIRITAAFPDTPPPPHLLGLVTAGTGRDRPGAMLQLAGAELLIAGPTDLHVAARGFATQLLRGVDGDRTVELRPWPTVSLELPAVDLPDEVTLRLRGTPSTLPIDATTVRLPGRTWRLRDFVRPRFRCALGAGRIVQVPVRAGGGYQLHLWMERHSRSVDLEGFTPTRLRSDATDARLVIPPAALRAALDAVRK